MINEVSYYMAIFCTITQGFLLYKLRGQHGKLESLVRIGGTACLSVGYAGLILSNILKI